MVREKALEVLRGRIEAGKPVYDFTGLASRADPSAEPDELRTYLCEALLGPKVEKEARRHFDAPGASVFVASRTTALIFAVTLAFEPERVLHVLPRGGKPHPSIEEACSLVGAELVEAEEGEYPNPAGFDLVFVTGCDVSWRVAREDTLEEVGSSGAVTVLDDASGDRVRRLHGQDPGPAYGFDLTVTSCDKLMDGPRAGLAVGDPSVVSEVRGVCESMGWTVDGPALAAVLNALRSFDERSLRRRYEAVPDVAGSLHDVLNVEVEETGAGVVLRGPWDDVEVALRLLRDHGMMTITALGYGGVERELRFNLLTSDAERFGYDRFVSVLSAELGDVR